MTRLTPMPGEPLLSTVIEQMIRVNQAGEYGAARIYQGQLDHMKHSPLKSLVEHMKLQEQVHLDTFNDQLVQRKIRPTVLSPLWHVAGYLLGAVTARLGDKAAMACTVAVEEVIQEHYAAQIEILKECPEEQTLYETIVKFQEEEQQHYDLSITAGAAEATGFRFGTALIKAASRLAIRLSSRL